MATMMLESSADIRFIHETLGHAELSTTQIYTQISIKKLKKIHTAAHQSARKSRERTVAIDDDVDSDEAA